MNLLPVVAETDGRVRLPDGSGVETGADLPAGAALTLGIRPEHVATGGGVNCIEAPVTMVESLGASHLAFLTLAGASEPLVCQLAERPRSRPERLTVSFPPERLHLFDAEGRALSHGRSEAIACAAV